ncbi:MAG: D-alanyl-D-alanine carboxypeptidase [Lachnospiraceae bacterium]|uniref:D-alanyl-D-alanine carboxypeptidase n=1 Tax=Candidatus Weimeria bifida TaxID=2599074 RepID=A0A6N7IY00_9FIRM|nr:D-alanyl-D-alanine carboxypeptidase [Candidatus Weimeria bifida]RRF96063.1 MAG: D-alanyl-D-alanine carboxypeptidase [Lachnospiraceae bacterium]
MSAAFILTGCSSEIKQQYSLIPRAKQYGLIKESTASLLGSQYCQYVPDSSGVSDNKTVYAAGAFNDTLGKTVYSQNLLKKIYPASTTKILTAYCALKYGDLKQVITVSRNAVDLPAGSSAANLKAGDKMTLEDLLKAMLIVSGNDAATAIAEAISGSVSDFAKLMNKEAASMGATHSNFVNANGLHDDNHYTCAYDMYIIFHNALKYPEFKKIIQAASMKATVTHADGRSEKVTYESTNLYKTKKFKVPDNITVVGGKTGTTDSAGYCLVLLSKNKQGQQIITTVFKAVNRWELYQMTNRLLTSFAST